MVHKISPAVKHLLKQYDDYKIINKRVQALSSQLAKAKILRADTKDLQVEYNRESKKLQKLSDDMTFDSPATWIGYKLEAYRQESQPILNMHDLRVHCSTPGYICTKRFIFLNRQLDAMNLPNLTDSTAFPDEMPLKKVLTTPQIKAVDSDENFMENGMIMNITLPTVQSQNGKTT